MGRRYQQFCGLAHALEIVGERWSGLIVRELMLGPRRYSDLRDGLPGIATNVLAERLKHLEAEGIVSRDVLPAPAGSTVYQLTDDGRAFAESLLPLARWGSRRLEESGDDHVRGEWLTLGLAAPVRPHPRAGGG